MLALLVACSNVAGLLVSRALRRRTEFAVRSALGAGRLRLARPLIAEVGLLFIAGTGAGLALAHVSLPVLVRQFSQGGAFLGDTPQIDVRVFAVMAAGAVATALMTSLGLIAGVRPSRGAVSVTSPASTPRRLPAHSEGVLPVVVNQTFVNRHFGTMIRSAPGPPRSRWPPDRHPRRGCRPRRGAGTDDRRWPSVPAPA